MKDNMKALNGLKIPFALMVILTHYQGNLCWAQSPVPFLKFFFDYGSLGVEFFFILSGFLIAYNYRERIHDMTFPAFWGGRMRKLLPYFIYGVVIDILVFILDQFVLKTNVFQYSTLKLNLFNVTVSFLLPLRAWIYTNVFNGVLWFMCDLSIAYALYYIISRFTKEHPGYYTMAISLVAVVSLDGMQRGGDYFIFPEHLFRTFSCFFSGLVLYEIHAWLTRNGTVNMKRIGYILFLMILLLAILTVVFRAEQVLGEDRLHVRMSFIIFTIPAMIITALNVPWVNKILSARPLQAIAGYTTALYVSHGDVIHLCHILQVFFHASISYLDPGVFVTIFVCCLIAAFISECLITKATGRIWNRKGR